MDTKCVKGIPIKRTPLFKLQKNWKGNLDSLEIKLKNQADGKI